MIIIAYDQNGLIDSLQYLSLFPLLRGLGVVCNTVIGAIKARSVYRAAAADDDDKHLPPTWAGVSSLNASARHHHCSSAIDYQLTISIHPRPASIEHTIVRGPGARPVTAAEYTHILTTTLIECYKQNQRTPPSPLL